MENQLTITPRELKDFEDFLRMSRKIKGKFSTVFLLDLIYLERAYYINPIQILESIVDVENKSMNSSKKKQQNLNGILTKAFGINIIL